MPKTLLILLLINKKIHIFALLYLCAMGFGPCGPAFGTAFALKLSIKKLNIMWYSQIQKQKAGALFVPLLQNYAFAAKKDSSKS